MKEGRDLLARATRRPWEAHHGWAEPSGPVPEHPKWCEITGGSFEDDTYMSVTGHIGIDNARLIAFAVNHLGDILDRLERADKALAAIAQGSEGGVMSLDDAMEIASAALNGGPMTDLPNILRKMPVRTLRDKIRSRAEVMRDLDGRLTPKQWAYAVEALNFQPVVMVGEGRAS